MSSHVISKSCVSQQNLQNLGKETLNEFNKIGRELLDNILPVFNEAAGDANKAIKIVKKGWAVVRWVFNDPSACRIRGDATNKVLTRQRRRWKQMRDERFKINNHL